MALAALAGLDLLATAIVLVDQELTVRYANPAAENLFELSSKGFVGHTVTEIFEESMLDAAIEYARYNRSVYTEHDNELPLTAECNLLHSCPVSPVELEG